MNETIRAAVRAKLAADGQTQADLAARAGLARPNLTRMLTGRSGRVPSAWRRVLDALGLELHVRRKP